MEVSATAPGKIILFGEHAVVHGQPAIAVPLPAVCARAVVYRGRPGGQLMIIAANLARTIVVSATPHRSDHALAVACRLLVDYYRRPLPNFHVLVHSTIPVASGLGSGAAATTALLKALSQALELDIDLETLNALVYEIEKLYHGTPSGIDNTVVVYEQPVYFVRGQPIETFAIGQALHLVVADTGVPSPTHVAVHDVGVLYQQEPARIGAIFERIGDVSREARARIELGDAVALGGLMRENHALLRDLTVSSPLLDKLVAAAEASGAYGAKLSGGGRGGNLIALTPPEIADSIARVLLGAGAKRVIQTTLA